jgi:hypothetical protein
MDQYPRPSSEAQQAESFQFQVLNYLGLVVLKYPRSTENVQVIDTPVDEYAQQHSLGLRSLGSSAQLSSRTIISTEKGHKWSVLYAYEPDTAMPKHVVIASLADDIGSRNTRREYHIDPVTGDVCHRTLWRMKRLHRVANRIVSAGYAAQNIALSYSKKSDAKASRLLQPKPTSLQGKQTLRNFLHDITHTYLA